MLGTVLAAQQVTTPVWTWVFFTLVLVAVVLVLGVGLRKMREARTTQQSRREARGLTPQQKAFQDEMRLMLQLRVQGQQDAPSAGEPSDDRGAGTPGR
jgi:hypothetical protein